MKNLFYTFLILIAFCTFAASQGIRRAAPMATSSGSSFPSTSLIDDFNRADESPLASGWTLPVWIGGGNVRVLSNSVTYITGDYGDAAWNTAPANDQEAWITFSTLTATGSPSASVFARLTNINGSTVRGYEVAADVNAGTIELKTMTPSFTTLDSASITLQQGDALGIRAVGTAITGWHKPSGGSWTQILSATDSSETSGRIGFGIYQGTFAVDDFGGGSTP